MTPQFKELLKKNPGKWGCSEDKRAKFFGLPGWYVHDKDGNPFVLCKTEEQARAIVSLTKPKKKNSGKPLIKS
jgi:phosphoenolpyruvate carboxylase